MRSISILSLPVYLRLASFRSLTVREFILEWTTSIVSIYRRRLFPVFSSSLDRNLTSFLLASFRHPFAWSLRPKMARFEIQEGTLRTRSRAEGGARGSTKLWQVEDERPPRSTSRHRLVRQVYGGIALHAWLARRSKETNRFTIVPVVSVQSTQIILPRVHCLRITRCISSRRSSFNKRGGVRCR